MLLVICSVIFIVLVASYTNYRSIPESSENNQPQNNPPENTEGPQLVIPENPVGTLGLISALTAAFGMFTIMKKRR